ncbi:MAG: hypothetical protein LBR07_04500 [Puniceicoccales bacterium]|nr:hypothetical protein [Puniceicoccales bacterium]
MSNTYHYLDENRTPQGPLPEEDIARLAETERQNGRELLVARPGDSTWLPYDAATNATAHIAPVRPQAARAAAPVRPQPARPQSVSAPVTAAPPAMSVSMPAPLGSMGAPMQPLSYMQQSAPPPQRGGNGGGGGGATPWLSIVCYVAAALLFLTLLANAILLLVNLPAGKVPGTYVVQIISEFAAAIIAGIAFAWLGNALALFSEIAANTRR